MHAHNIVVAGTSPTTRGSIILRTFSTVRRSLAPVRSGTTRATLVPMGALTVTAGLQLYRRLPIVFCEAPAHTFNMDKFFRDQEKFEMTSKSMSDAMRMNRNYYGWCVAFARWGKWLFALGLALVGSFVGWYFSKFQREMADRLWPAFIFGALPMLVGGYVCRAASAVLFVVSTGYGYFTTMNYWEVETVAESIHKLTPLLVNHASVTDMVGDWGNNLKPHLETYEIATPLFRFALDPKSSERGISNTFVFCLAGSKGQAVVRVVTELHVKDQREYEEQVYEFMNVLEDYSRSLFRLLQPFNSAPGPYPTIPQLEIRNLDLPYVDVVCIAGPRAGQRVVLVDKMQRYAKVKEFLSINNSDDEYDEDDEEEDK